MGQSITINAKSSCQEVAFELVTTTQPDPHNWTLNSCFSVLRNVWGALGTVSLLH